ncbi:MAG: hypothetical protein KGY80_02935 [Candidatus Thorarchaeota archaeon]|nr:hypothetical protein [Candidatus Thorarchaeota archaeon]
MPPNSISTNTVMLTTLAILAAMGVWARLFVKIPIIAGLLELTPGFMFSELGGIIGGLAGGVFVGAIVGIGGAVAGGEPFLLPMIGNIFLGIGTGWVIKVAHDRDSIRYRIMVILGGALIGGFFPSVTIFAFFTESLEAAIIFALLDAFQAGLWAAVALFVEKIIREIIGNYIYEKAKTDISGSKTRDDMG